MNELQQVVDCYTHVRNVGQNIILGCVASGWREREGEKGGTINVCTYTRIIPCRATILAKEEASTWRTIDRRINTSSIRPFHGRSGTCTAMVQGRQKPGGKDKDISLSRCSRGYRGIESMPVTNEIRYATEWIVVPGNCNDRILN